MSNLSPTAIAFGSECFSQAGYSSSYEPDSRDQTGEWDFMQALLHDYYPWMPDPETHDPAMGSLPPPDETRPYSAPTVPVEPSTPTCPVPGELAPSLPVNNSFLNHSASPRDVPSQLQALRTELEADNWFAPLPALASTSRELDYAPGVLSSSFQVHVPVSPTTPDPTIAVPTFDLSFTLEQYPPVLNGSQSKDFTNDGTSSGWEPTPEASPPDVEAEDWFAPLSPGVNDEVPIDSRWMPQSTLLSLPSPATGAAPYLHTSPVSDKETTTPSSDSHDSLFTPPPLTPPELPQLQTDIAPGVPSSPSQLPIDPSLLPHAQLPLYSLPPPALGSVGNPCPIHQSFPKDISRQNAVPTDIYPVNSVVTRPFIANAQTHYTPASMPPGLQQLNNPYHVEALPQQTSMVFGSNPNFRFAFYSPYRDFVAPNFIPAPHVPRERYPPSAPFVSAPVIPVQPLHSASPYDQPGPSTLLPAPILPAHVPRPALRADIANTINIADERDTLPLSRTKARMFWNGMLTASEFHCHWGSCKFELKADKRDTDDDFHISVVRHLKQHLKPNNPADESLFHSEKTWQCLWAGCQDVFTDSTSRQLERHLLSNDHKISPVQVKHFCIVNTCTGAWSRDYAACKHLQEKHPGVPVPEHPDSTKKRKNTENASQLKAKRQRT